ncbi:MAG: DUF4932 domain-containing protein, partial [Mucinivorans sp.]
TFAKTLQPIEKTLGKLTISIDPRMELLSAIEIIEGQNETPFKNAYTQALATSFLSFDSFDAVELTHNLSKSNCHAPAAFMLHLAQPQSLSQTSTYSKCLIDRAGGVVNLEILRQAMGLFAQKSGFDRYWTENRDTFKGIIDATVAQAEGVDWIGVMENYMGSTQESYHLVIVPLLKENHHQSVAQADGTIKVYALMATDSTTYINRAALESSVWYEFSHSFITPLVEKYSQKVDSTASIFTPIDFPLHQYVGDEIANAVSLRLRASSMNQTQYEALLAQQEDKGMSYTPALVEKLKEYEVLRALKGTTFEEFFPQLLEVF